MDVVRTAFVLGAGLGTRLKALTSRRPKPLIPVVNRPLITYAFDHLLGAGVGRFVVNTHWRAEAYDTAFPDATYRGAPIAFHHESPKVLETAGGIKNAEDLLQDGPFWVYNGDILGTLPLEAALRAHFDRGNEVTLVLRSKDGPLQISCDEASGRIFDIGRRLDPASEPRFLFTGIYLVNSEFLARIPPAKVISVVPIFCDMIRAGAKLGGVVIDEGEWWDLGTREQYLAVHRALHCGTESWIAPGAKVAASAQISGATAIGSGARIGDGAKLRDCIVWENARIAAGSELERCVVTADALAEGTLTNADI